MKARPDPRPGVEVEFETVRDVPMAWVRLPDLTRFSKKEVGRAHLHALRQAFMAAGPERAVIVKRAVEPLEAEPRRRGLEADYWSIVHKRRSDAAFLSEQN